MSSGMNGTKSRGVFSSVEEMKAANLRVGVRVDVYGGDTYDIYATNQGSSIELDNGLWADIVVTGGVTYSELTTAQNDIVGGSIFKGSNGEYVQNGDVVPVGTTHLRVLAGGGPKIVRMGVLLDGAVSGLTESSATIGGTTTTLHEFLNGGYQATNDELLVITPAMGEMWFNATDNTIHMGDGVTVGGNKTGGYNINIRQFGARPGEDITGVINSIATLLAGKRATLELPEGVYNISGVASSPENITLNFTGAVLNITGELSIFGKINADRYRIFSYTGSVLNVLKGAPTNDCIFPEWFGGSMSPVGSPIDATDGINDSLLYSRAAKVWCVMLAGGMGRETNGSRYHVTNILVPSRTLFTGRDRDDTFLKQIAGSTGAVVSDLPETGAERVKIQKMSIDCNNNAGSSGVVLGFNPAFVWGVEGYIDDIQVRNFDNYGVHVKASVSQMHRITCITGKDASSVGMRLEGGSVFCYGYITNAVANCLEFTGSSHKVYGAHFELNADSRVIDFDSGAIGCGVHGATFLRRTNNPTNDVIHFHANSFDNAFYDFGQLETADWTVSYTVNDESTKFQTYSKMKSYVQGGEYEGTTVVDDSNTSAGGFLITNPMRRYVYTGTAANAYFRMPKVAEQNDGLEIEIVNATNIPLRALANLSDVGQNIFYGDVEEVTFPARSRLTFTFVGGTIVYA